MKLKKHLLSLLAVIFCFVMASSVTSCSDEPDADDLVGIWLASEKDGSYTYYLKIQIGKDGSFKAKSWDSDETEPDRYEDEGRWSVNGNKFIIDWDGDLEYHIFTLKGDTLTLKFLYDEEDEEDYEIMVFHRVK